MEQPSELPHSLRNLIVLGYVGYSEVQMLMISFNNLGNYFLHMEATVSRQLFPFLLLSTVDNYYSLEPVALALSG